MIVAINMYPSFISTCLKCRSKITDVPQFQKTWRAFSSFAPEVHFLPELLLEIIGAPTTTSYYINICHMFGTICTYCE